MIQISAPVRNIKILIHPYFCQADWVQSLTTVHSYYRRIIENCAQTPSDHLVFIPISPAVASNLPNESASHPMERRLWEFIRSTFGKDFSRVTMAGSANLTKEGYLTQNATLRIDELFDATPEKTFYASDFSASLVELPEGKIFRLFKLGREYRKILNRILPLEQKVDEIQFDGVAYSRFDAKERINISAVANGELLDGCVLDNAVMTCAALGLPINNLIIDAAQYAGTEWEGNYKGIDMSPRALHARRSLKEIFVIPAHFRYLLTRPQKY